MGAEMSSCDKMQREVAELFRAQDPDTGFFDVVFEIDDNKLYAHRYRLSAISPTFKSMLSERWSLNKNDAIKIKDYKFEEFNEFLIFIYSGSCNITDENIFTMVDMAEFYGVQVFKDECDKFLSKMDINFQNVFQLLELSDKYSLIILQESLKEYVSKIFESIVLTETFKASKKSIMKIIVEACKNTILSEKLFETVFKGAEYRAIEKKEADENIILNDAIKEELSDILPLINFQRMDIEFLLNFVVKKSFLFSGDFLSELLLHAWKRVYVKVIDRNGRIMKGFLNCPDIDGVAAVIHSKKDIYCDIDASHVWSTKQPKPSEPSTLIKNDDIEWYLIYDRNGNLVIRRRADLENEDFLLAEMFAEDGFELNCKIEVYRSV